MKRDRLWHAQKRRIWVASSFGFGAGWLLADWVFRTQGFGTHDVSSGLDATRSGTGLDG